MVPKSKNCGIKMLRKSDAIEKRSEKNLIRSKKFEKGVKSQKMAFLSGQKKMQSGSYEYRLVLIE